MVDWVLGSFERPCIVFHNGCTNACTTVCGLLFLHDFSSMFYLLPFLVIAILTQEWDGLSLLVFLVDLGFSFVWFFETGSHIARPTLISLCSWDWLWIPHSLTATCGPCGAGHLLVVLMFISLMAKDIEYFFFHIFAQHLYSLKKCIFREKACRLQP